MSMYSVALYLHIIGAVGLFAGLGMEGIIYKNLKTAATPQQVLAWGIYMRSLRTVFLSSTLFLFVSGVFLVTEAWGWNAWVITGLILLIGLSLYGSSTGKKIGMTIGSLVGKDGPLSDDVKNRISSPSIMKSYKVKITLALGIIFIMTIKPDWAGSIISIVLAFVFGLLLDLPARQKEVVKDLESAQL